MRMDLNTAWREIIKDIDFENIHKVMKCLDWNWYLGRDEKGNENHGVPSLETIKRHSLYLFEKSYNERKSVSSGGFTVEYLGNGEFNFYFSIEETSITI